MTLPCAADPELWFSDDPAEQEQAKTACGFCPIAGTCLAGALDRGEEFGIWGGVAMSQPAAWLRPMVFAPRHGENRFFEKCTAGEGGTRCADCRRAHAEYVAVWRLERKWIAPPEPELRPEQLPLFQISPDTDFGRISA